MPIYIVLGTLTDQGAKDIKNLRQRVEANLAQAEQMGIKQLGWYLTQGRYDFAVITEAPDDQTMAAQVLSVAGKGASRTETLRAFTLDEVDQIIGKIG